MLPSMWRVGCSAVLLLAGVALAVLGFASPMLPYVTWETAWKRVAIGLILDVSRSMGAVADPDASTTLSRLELLKQAVQELLVSLPSGVRIGVVVFAGVAVPLVPEPTADLQAVLAKIRRLYPEFIINPGSNLAAAIRQGLTLFTAITTDERPDTVALILLSDGDTTLTPELRQVVQRATLPIFALGVGLSQAVRIPDARFPSGVTEDQRGRLVTTAVNDAMLRFIAEQTGGIYTPV
jgi:hypothetical protein